MALGLALGCLVSAAGCGAGTGDRSTTPAPGSTPTDSMSTAPPATEATTPDSTSRVSPPPARPGAIVDLTVQIVATHPHDPGAYTQGLEMVDGLLLESTGLRGESTIRLVEPRTGEIRRSAALDPHHFGEGATVVDDEIWQLTWQSETLLVHGLDDLVERRRVPYRGDGWGLCATPERLIMSDGSSQLTLRDRNTFAPLGTVTVTADGVPVDKLNELECVDGMVWANVFQTTRLLAIDPTDGRVVAEADLRPLVPPGLEGDGSSVANGIAHDSTTGRFWLTGKLWPLMYEVELLGAVPAR